LIAIVIFILAVIGWIVLNRLARRPGDHEREQRLREALQRLAVESKLTFDSGPPGGTSFIRWEEDGISFRVEPGTRGFPFDGDVVLIASCATDGTVVAWPREPPDEVVEGLGRERSTADETFDSRFAVFASSLTVMRSILDETIRGALMALGVVALVVRDGEALLLLAGVPSSRALRATSILLARIAERSTHSHALSSGATP
jgi:hypothetical protein